MEKKKSWSEFDVPYLKYMYEFLCNGWRPIISRPDRKLNRLSPDNPPEFPVVYMKYSMLVRYNQFSKKWILQEYKYDSNRFVFVAQDENLDDLFVREQALNNPLADITIPNLTEIRLKVREWLVILGYEYEKFRLAFPSLNSSCYYAFSDEDETVLVFVKIQDTFTAVYLNNKVGRHAVHIDDFSKNVLEFREKLPEKHYQRFKSSIKGSSITNVKQS